MYGINVTDLWKSVAAIAFSGAALVAVFAFVARSVFLHFLSHDLETHKAKLAAENALVLEHFKAELHAAAFEHETRFARLHERRIHIIAELYKRLVAMDTAFQALLAPPTVGEIEKEAERQITALQKAGAFFDYFEGRRIYFDDSLCKLIDIVDETYRKSWNRYAALGKGRFQVEQFF